MSKGLTEMPLNFTKQLIGNLMVSYFTRKITAIWFYEFIV